MICPNKECGEHILKKDLENHIKNECKYTLIKCQYCEYKYPKYKILEHENKCNLANQSFNSSNSNMLNTSGNNININDDNNNNKILKNENNNFMQTLSDNIGKILKEKNINSENNENDKEINIKEKDNIKKANNIFNNDNQNNSMDNNNNNELSRLTLKQSTAQIEEDDLIDILKKAIEEKLNERFINLDSNLDKILKDIQTIKKFVCSGNNKENNNNINEKNDKKESR